MTIRSKARPVLIGMVLLSIPLALLGFFFLVQAEFAEIRTLRTSVDRSIETRTELARLLSEHQDVETGQRGFVLTQDRAFLEPYATAGSRIDTSFGRLERNAQGDAQFIASLNRLRNLSKAKLDFADRTVRLADRGLAGESRSMIASGQGKRLMDEIRAEIGKLDRREAARLSAMTGARDDSRFDVERMINLILAALALLLAVVAIYTGRTIRQRQAALAHVRGMRDRQRAILNGAVDGMMVLDDQGYIRECNPSVTRMFGYAENDLLGQHNTVLMANPPSLELSQAWLRTVGAAGFEGAGKRQEFIGRRSDGTIMPTDVAISRFVDGDNTSYIAIIRDMTERKRIEEMKTEFVSTVSHELRTPLTSIGGSLGLLAAGAVGPLNEKAARLVAIAHNNCERLIRLINDILDIEKIESGKMNFDLRRMPLGPLIERTVAANRGFGAGHSVEVRAETPPWPVSVMGDPDRLEQLLTNLVSNAIKHSPPGGKVDVRISTSGGRAKVEVLDRGAGVPAEFRDRIFGKFAMADGSDSRTKGGTGLGLSIAREIAERHGGQVGFEDRSGGGTLFFFDLPLAACEDASDAGEDDDSLPLLLHIDDDRDCLSVVASAFANRARVISVSNLREANEAIAARRFAGAIVDVMVSPENGLDLIPGLRAAAPGLPIIVFSALDDVPPTPEVDTVLIKSRTSFSTLVETTMALVSRHARETA